MRKFFTIDGVDDDVPAHDPDTVKFYDRRSAEETLKVLKAFSIVPETCYVAEYEDLNA